MFHTLLKSLPLLFGIFLPFLIDLVLSKSTHQFADDEFLIRSNDKERHTTLDYLLRWRDLLIGILTGAFVLQFSAAEKLDSNTSLLSNASLIVTVVLMPVALLAVWLLSDRFRLVQVRKNRRYLLWYSLLVLPWYLFSLVFVYG